jgi:hypothetical protein
MRLEDGGMFDLRIFGRAARDAFSNDNNASVIRYFQDRASADFERHAPRAISRNGIDHGL